MTARLGRKTVVALLLATIAVTFASCSRRSATPTPGHVSPGRRPVIGRITKVDPGRKAVTIDVGSSGGLEPGMELEVLRPAPDPTFSDDGTNLAWITATRVGEHETMAEIESVSNEDEVRIQPGDWVLMLRCGRVTAYDHERGEARIDLGAAGGAVVGLRLRVEGPGPPPKPGESTPQVDPEFRPSLEVTAVGDHESTARIVPPDASAIGYRTTRVDPRPGDAIFPEDEADRESLRNVALAMGNRPDALQRLGRDRVDLARRNLSWSEAGYEAGSISIDRFIDASRRLLEASRDAATTRDERVAALRAHLGRMTRLVTRESAKLEMGAGGVPNLEESRYAQAEAAFLLARALRRGPDGR